MAGEDAFESEDAGSAFQEGDADSDAAKKSGEDAGDAGKKAGEEGSSDEGGAGGEQPGAGAPEKYEPFTVPEGMELDEDELATFSEAARKAGYSQEQAQVAIDAVVKGLERAAEQSTAFWKQSANKWAEASRTQGLMAQQSLQNAQAGLTAAGGDSDLVKLLRETGLNKHPVFIRVFSEYGKARSEDTISSRSPGGSSPSRKPDHEVLYGSH